MLLLFNKLEYRIKQSKQKIVETRNLTLIDASFQVS